MNQHVPRLGTLLRMILFLTARNDTSKQHKSIHEVLLKWYGFLQIIHFSFRPTKKHFAFHQLNIIYYIYIYIYIYYTRTYIHVDIIPCNASVLQLDNEFPITQSFMTVFTKARHWSLWWVTLIQFTSSILFVRSILYFKTLPHPLPPHPTNTNKKQEWQFPYHDMCYHVNYSK